MEMRGMGMRYKIRVTTIVLRTSYCVLRNQKSKIVTDVTQLIIPKGWQDCRIETPISQNPEGMT